jgi:hypothetical protein
MLSLLIRSLALNGARNNEPLAVVVKHANRPDPHQVCNVHSLFPTLRVNLLIQTLSVLSVKTITISTVHFQPRSLILLFLVPWTLGVASAQTSGGPSLELRGRDFIIRENGKTSRISAEMSKVRHPDRAIYRKDASFAVWDSRGLTIRKDGKTRTTRLPDIALTPKLFSRDEILHTKDLIASGERSKNASALSGSRRMGDSVYFLVRWDDSAGKPWMEALVQVDLVSPGLDSKLLGRFDGLTLAKEQVDDRLFVLENNPASVTSRPDGTWGVSSVDTGNDSFSYKPAGQGLAVFWHLSPKTILAEEHTSYGSKTLARVDLATGTRRVVQEFRGQASVVSPEKPLVMRFSTPEGEFLRNIDAGSELKIKTTTGAKAAGGFIVIWPGNEPSKALMYEPERFNRVAGQSTGDRNTDEPASPPSRSHNRRGRHAQPGGHPNP